MYILIKFFTIAVSKQTNDAKNMKTLKTIILLLCFIVILSSLYLAIVIPSLDIAKTVILSVISIICFIISFVIIENFNK